MSGPLSEREFSLPENAVWKCLGEDFRIYQCILE